MRTITIVATAMLCLCALVSAGNTAGAKSSAAASWALSVLPDPGPKPTLDPRDYDAYMKEGTSILTGHATLPASFGRDLTCFGEDVLLYPSTAYTRWIVQTWARELDGGTEEFGLTEPDDYHTGVQIPSYLKALGAGHQTAVRFGHCDKSNNMYVGKIPAGRYLLVTKLNREVSGEFHHEYGQVIVQTPNGEYPENYVTNTTGGYRYDDGYIATFDGELEITAGQHYSLATGALRAVAHYHPSKGA